MIVEESLDFFMHTYYYEHKLTTTILLSPEESNHAVKVMRSKEGDQVEVINGKGEKGIGRISHAHPKKCEIKLDEITFEAQTQPLVSIAIAPTKSNDRIEFFIEKVTEIGIDFIFPLITKNSERNKINLDRWNKVAIAAMKQSKRLWLPVITDLTKIDELLKGDLPVVKLIAYCEDLPEESITTYRDNKENKLLLIGPEGDFTAEEVSLCESKGFKRVNLGNNRLRTETAGIVGVTMLKI